MLHQIIWEEFCILIWRLDCDWAFRESRGEFSFALFVARFLFQSTVERKPHEIPRRFSQLSEKLCRNDTSA